LPRPERGDDELAVSSLTGRLPDGERRKHTLIIVSAMRYDGVGTKSPPGGPPRTAERSQVVQPGAVSDRTLVRRLKRPCLHRHLICGGNVAPHNGCGRPPGQPQRAQTPGSKLTPFFQEKGIGARFRPRPTGPLRRTQNRWDSCQSPRAAPSRSRSPFEVIAGPARAPGAPPCDATPKPPLRAIDLRIDRAPAPERGQSCSRHDPHL
jgi:hypothetical protein